MFRVKSDKSLEAKEPEVEVSGFKGAKEMNELEGKERPTQKEAKEPEVGVSEFMETKEVDELEEKETPKFLFKFQFQTYREEDEPVLLSSVPPTSTNKYEFLSERDFSHYLEKPEVVSLTVKELYAGSNGEFFANKKIMEDGVLSNKDFAEKESESEAESVREEIKEISADSVRDEYDASRDDDAPLLTEKDFILSDSIVSSHEFMSRYVASTSDGFLSDKDFEDVFGLGILKEIDGQTEESTDENLELEYLDLKNLNAGYEADDFDEEDSNIMEELEKKEEAVQNPAKVEEDTEMLSDKDFEDNNNSSKKEHGCKENEAKDILDMPKSNSQNSSAADSEDSNGLETLWEHQDLIEQLKMELKKVRATGLPTILEEDESPKIMEDLKPWKIDEKFQHEDRMGELHKFYKSYRERMRKFDILNYQKMYAMSFLQSKDPLKSITRREASAPALTSLLSQKFLLSKRKKSSSDPMVNFIRELHNDLEVVYVGQLCLSWEILHWQYEKALELWDSDPYGMRLYNEVAGEFQQFQVLLQRFIENEPFEGPRVQNYIKNRCVLRNLLQVPVIREDSMKDKKARGKGKDGDSITSDMLVEIMEESIRIFWQFVRSDKDAENVISKGRKGTQIEPQDPTELELLTEVRFRTGAVNSAAGSAYAEFGNTKVIVSVFGPRESKKAMVYSDVGRLNCNVSCTTFATPARGLGSDNKEFSSMLHKALEGAIMLETFPKTTVDVFALVLESGGSDLPVVISCASLALADAGIMMYDLVAGVSVSCLGRNLIIDPILEEESFQDGSLMITCMPSRYEVTQLSITGEWSTAKLNEAMHLCLDACSKLDKIMRACLKEAASASLD